MDRFPRAFSFIWQKEKAVWRGGIPWALANNNPTLFLKLARENYKARSTRNSARTRSSVWLARDSQTLSASNSRLVDCFETALHVGAQQSFSSKPDSRKVGPSMHTTSTWLDTTTDSTWMTSFSHVHTMHGWCALGIFLTRNSTWHLKRSASETSLALDWGL